MKKIMMLTICATMMFSLATYGNQQKKSTVIGGDPATWGPALEESESHTTTEENVKIPSPFTKCDTLEEASLLAGFDIELPDSLEGYSTRIIQTAKFDDNSSMIDVIYQNNTDVDTENGTTALTNEDEIRIRKSNTTEEISGDYTEYGESHDIIVDELTVTMKGNQGNVSLATWTDGTYMYSIGAYSANGTGVSELTMTELVKMIK